MVFRNGLIFADCSADNFSIPGNFASLIFIDYLNIL